MLALGKQNIKVKDVSSWNISDVIEVVLWADEFHSPFVEEELSKFKWKSEAILSLVPRSFTQKMIN